MSALAVGALLGGILGQAPRPKKRSGATHRTGAPVRRDSKEAGTFEDAFFVKPEIGEPDTLLRKLRTLADRAVYLKRDRRAGRRLNSDESDVARVTQSVCRVYEELCTLARLNAGKIFPSYDHLMAVTGYVRQTVAKALNVLDKLGFLNRQRRFKRVDDDLGAARYKQTSNAYQLSFAEKLIAFLPRRMRPAPQPIDEAQREIERQDEQSLMEAQLGCRDLARISPIDDARLADRLVLLGAAVDRNAAGPSDRRNPE